MANTTNLSLTTILCIAIPLGVVALVCLVIVFVLAIRFTCIVNRLKYAEEADNLARQGDYRRRSATRSMLSTSSNYSERYERSFYETLLCLPAKPRKRNKNHDQSKTKETHDTELPNGQIPPVSNENGRAVDKPHPKLAGISSTQQNRSEPTEITNTAVPRTQSSNSEHGNARESTSAPPKPNDALTDQELPPQTPSGAESVAGSKSVGPADNPGFNVGTGSPYPFLSGPRSDVGTSSPWTSYYEDFNNNSGSPRTATSRTGGGQLSNHPFVPATVNMPEPPGSSPAQATPDMQKTREKQSASVGSGRVGVSGQSRSPRINAASPSSPAVRQSQPKDSSRLQSKSSLATARETALLESASDPTPPARSLLRPKASALSSKSSIVKNPSPLNPNATGTTNASLTFKDLKSAELDAGDGTTMATAQESFADLGDVPDIRDLTNLPMPPSAQSSATWSRFKIPVQSPQASISGFSGQQPDLRSSPSKQFAPSTQDGRQLGLLWNQPESSFTGQRNNNNIPSSTPAGGSLIQAGDGFRLANKGDRHTGMSNTGGDSIMSDPGSIISMVHTGDSINSPLLELKGERSPDDLMQANASDPKISRDKMLNMLRQNENVHESHERTGRKEVERGHSTAQSFSGSVVIPPPSEKLPQLAETSPIGDGRESVSSYRKTPLDYTLSPVDTEFSDLEPSETGRNHDVYDDATHPEDTSVQDLNSSIHGSPAASTQSPVAAAAKQVPAKLSPASSSSSSYRKSLPSGFTDTPVFPDPSQNAIKTGPAQTLLVMPPTTRRPDPLQTSSSIRDIAALNEPNSPRSPGYQPKASITGKPLKTPTLVAPKPVTVEGSSAKLNSVPNNANRKSVQVLAPAVKKPNSDQIAARRKSTLAYGTKEPNNQTHNKTEAVPVAKAKMMKNRGFNKPLPSTPYLLEEGVVANLEGAKFTAIYTYTSSLSDELDLDPGDVVKVFEVFDDGWCLARISKPVRYRVGRNDNGVCPRSCLSKHQLAAH